MSGTGSNESIRTLLTRGGYKELVTYLESASDVAGSIIAGSAWFQARDRADRALELVERELESNEDGLARVAHAMATVLREEPLDDELAQALGPPEEDTLDPWLMVSVMDFCDYAAAYDVSAEWRSRLVDALDAQELPDDEEAICRAHTACSLLRAALELAPEMALKAAEASLPLFADSIPAAHPRRVEYFAMFSAAAAVHRNAAFIHAFVDAAHREALEMPEGNERIRRMTDDMWEATGRPESTDLGSGIRVIAVGKEALGFFARRGQDLYSCMARHSTAADLLGALTRGDRTWRHPNVGLRLEGGPASAVRLVLAATHPEADDFEADLDPEHVAALLAFASVHDLPVRQFIGVGRNEPCPCGSGKKFKRCCGVV